MIGDYDYSITVPNGTTWPITPYTTGTFGNTFDWYTVTSPVYMYQIKCPKRGCKKMNWLQLDKIAPCANCGMKLKAVAEKADAEITITT